MPIRILNKERVVFCVNSTMNDHALRYPELTTMSVDGGTSYAVTVVVPPTVPGGPRFDPAAGMPLKAFVCRVCGYVELYSAFATDPAWGRR